MKIEHIALWVQDLEIMKEFYTKYFVANAGDKYHNPQKNFSSYFLSFSTGTRVEIMHKPEIAALKEYQTIGLAHFAISVGTEEKVNQLTEELAKEGFEISEYPRWTGDGYYESKVFDPEHNLIELTI